MKRNLIFATLAAAAVMATSCCCEAENDVVAKDFKFIEGQIPVALEAIDTEVAALKASGNYKKGLARQVVPASVETDGKFKLVGGSSWVCGFFPGTLWYTYEYTNDPKIAKQAEKFTNAIEEIKYRTTTHDLGFMVYCSFGNGYRLTGNEAYRDVVVQATESLCTRFKPEVGLIRSWDHNADKWGYPVIIDNMMNLEMLFEAYKMTGNKKYYDIAVSHADKTMANHFREDYSTYHVVDYNAKGEAVKHQTHQGYADDSAWARGQAWGLYGYTMMYRYTQDQKYLDQANHIANFILTNPTLPEDLVPYWDYNDPKIPNVPRDVSAAAIVASALYELSTYTPAKSEEYLAKADKMVQSISDKYLATPGGDFGFITTQSTGNMPKNSEVNVPISYADYYFVEALIRKDRLAKGENVL